MIFHDSVGKKHDHNSYQFDWSIILHLKIHTNSPCIMNDCWDSGIV